MVTRWQRVGQRSASGAELVFETVAGSVDGEQTCSKYYALLSTKPVLRIGIAGHDVEPKARAATHAQYFVSVLACPLEDLAGGFALLGAQALHRNHTFVDWSCAS